jgi:hypothetical protein
LLQLLSGSGLVFALLAFLLRAAVQDRFFEPHPNLGLLLIIYFFRISPIGFGGLVLAPTLWLASGGRQTRHLLWALAGSITGTAIFLNILGEDWRSALEIIQVLILRFDTYGFGLMWGGAASWLLSRPLRPSKTDLAPV